MRYYKRLRDKSYGLIPGKIYPEKYITYNNRTVQYSVDNYASSWQEVSELAYDIQEGIITELPEKWCVAVSGENTPKEVYEWRGMPFYEKGYICSNKLWHADLSKEYKEITLDRFKKYVLKINKKEIIGYKLKDDCKQYEKAALKISNTTANWKNSLMQYDISAPQTNYINKLTEAGVLTLWFEEIYESKLKIGDSLYILKEIESGSPSGSVIKITGLYNEGGSPSGNVWTKYTTLNTGYLGEFRLSAYETYFRIATPSEIAEATKPKEKVLYFGDVKFTIKQGKDFADTTHGNIPKSDIKKAIDYIENPPTLKGYNLKIYDTTKKEGYNIVDLDDSDSVRIAFGCTKGKFSELEDIYNAFE